MSGTPAGFSSQGWLSAARKCLEVLNFWTPRSPPLEPNEIAPLLLLLYSLDCKFFPDPALWLQDKNLCLGHSTGGKNPLALKSGAITARRRGASRWPQDWASQSLLRPKPSRPRGGQAGQTHWASHCKALNSNPKPSLRTTETTASSHCLLVPCIPGTIYHDYLFSPGHLLLPPPLEGKVGCLLSLCSWR